MTLAPATDTQVAAARPYRTAYQRRIDAEHRAAATAEARIARLQIRERSAWEAYRTARAKAEKTRNAGTLQAVIDAGDRWQHLNNELHVSNDEHERRLAKIAKAGRL
jgi:hypothetical protein